MVGTLGSQSLHSKSKLAIPRPHLPPPYIHPLLGLGAAHSKACQPVPCLATLIKLCSSNIGH